MRLAKTHGDQQGLPLGVVQQSPDFLRRCRVVERGRMVVWRVDDHQSRGKRKGTRASDQLDGMASCEERWVAGVDLGVADAGKPGGA